MNDPRRFAPATARNREPILEVLRRHVTAGVNVLEIASGSGEHAVFLAPRLEVASWQPTDPDPESRRSIDAWRAQEGVASVLPAIELDVTMPWPRVSRGTRSRRSRRPSLTAKPDIVMCVNMIHISPWRATLSLFQNAAATLPVGGLLYLYGPYQRGGRHTAPSNEAFDASLRSRNPEWGVRDLDEVITAAAAQGLELVEDAGVVEMPANNLSVVLRRKAPVS